MTDKEKAAIGAWVERLVEKVKFGEFMAVDFFVPTFRNAFQSD